MYSLYRMIICVAIVCLIGFAIQAQPVSEFVFSANTVFETNQPIYTLDVGELDESTGLEVVFQVNSGHVWMLKTEDWSTQAISELDDVISTMSNRPTIAIGDVVASVDGLEVVASSNSYVQAIMRESDGWTHEIIFDRSEMTGMLWGARVGDYIPYNDFEEVFVIYEGVFDFSVGTAYYRDDEGWQEELLYSAEVGMDSTVGIFNTDIDFYSPIIVVTTEMGPTYTLNITEEVADPTMNWNTIWDNIDNAGWVVKIGDVMPDNRGNEAVYGTRYNNRILVSYPTEDYPKHEVQVAMQGFQDENTFTMWDIDLGNILNDFPGDEIVSVDNTGRVYLVWRNETEWESQIIWQSNTPLFAVKISDVNLDYDGNEILVAGQNGKITEIRLQDTSHVTPWTVY